MNPYRHATILGIIILAAIVFAAEMKRESSFAETHGVVPSVVAPAFRALTQGELQLSNLKPLSRLVTALFLHGGIEHLAYNMVFLWAFGYLVSQQLGQWWVLAIFLLTGVCGNVVQILLDPESPIPVVGASGAICGLEGVYFGLALRWQMPWPNVWPLAHPIPPLQLGAVAIIGFIGDIYLLAHQLGEIAYGAHIGGLISGVLLAATLTTIYPTLRAYERATGAS